MATGVLTFPNSFAAYVAFGLRWGDGASRPQADRPGSQQAGANPAGGERIIDVEAVPVAEPESSAKPQLLVSPVRRALGEAQVAAYAPPTQHGQAPRLVYTAQPPGSILSAWA